MSGEKARSVICHNTLSVAMNSASSPALDRFCPLFFIANAGSHCNVCKTFPHMMTFNVQAISAFRAEFRNGLQIYDLISVCFILSKKIKCLGARLEWSFTNTRIQCIVIATICLNIDGSRIFPA